MTDELMLSIKTIAEIMSDSVLAFEKIFNYCSEHRHEMGPHAYAVVGLIEEHLAVREQLLRDFRGGGE